jgi:hypothetical protein
MERLDPKDLLPGDVLLYHGRSLLARLIRFFDGTEVNHAALFLGKGKVGEALARGLTRQTLKKSMGDDAYVVVRRLKTLPETMEPVVRKGEAYLDLGNRYAFDQLLLLAFLGLTRKLPVNPYLKGLLRKIFDRAASWLTAQGQRQPMICSEFVYRCYDEALPTTQDPYSLEICPLPRDYPGGTPKTFPGRSRPGTLHRDSLLLWAETVYGQSRRKGGDILFPERGKKAAKALSGTSAAEERKAADLTLEDLAERYLGAVKTPVPQARTLEASLRSPEMLEAISRFLSAWYQAFPPAREKKKIRGKRSAKEVDWGEALKRFLETTADFVTPGDLLHCQDLFSVGSLHPKGN